MEISVQNGGIVEFVGAEKSADYIKEAGFTAIDWNIDHGWSRSTVKELGKLPDGCIFDKSMEEIIAYWQPEIDAYKSRGLKLGQAHAPFPAFVFDNPDFFDYAINVYKNCIRLCDYADCPYLVIHGITLSSKVQNYTHEQVKALNYKLYESLIPVLKETNVTVCLENLFTGSRAELRCGHCSDPYEAVEFIDTLNEKAGKECFGLCVDTGHLHLLHIDVRNYVSMLAHRIKALHIHDNDSTSDNHLAPYAGSFPWDHFLSVMKEVGYQGNLNFETFAQVLPTRIPEALLPEFLRHIYNIGAYFKSKLQ